MSTTISVRLSEEMVRGLDALAGMENCSRARIIREAIIEYLSEYRDCLIAQERLSDRGDFVPLDRLSGERHDQ
ncbi:MAG: DUF6290 family protein [Thermoplasmata archaeon]